MRKITLTLYVKENCPLCEKARKILEKAKIKVEKENKKVSLLNMDAQHFAFKDRSFEMVFTTFLFCSVFDPIKGLHIRAENEFVGKIMDFFNLLIFKKGKGCCDWNLIFLLDTKF